MCRSWRVPTTAATVRSRVSSNMWWAGPCPFSPSYVGRRVASESVNNSLTRWTEGAELRRATPCVSVPS